MSEADVKWVLSFASIPVVASLIGYGTNVLAIQMTFLPLEYNVGPQLVKDAANVRRGLLTSFNRQLMPR